MDSAVNVYQKVINLSDTTMEGLEHIYSRTMGGRFEETIILYTDVASSFYEMQMALAVSLPGYEESDLRRMSDAVVEGMKLVLSAYESKRDLRPMEVLQFAMLPAYRRWYNELQEKLGEICAPAMH